MKNRTNILLFIFFIIFLGFVYFWYARSKEASKSVLTDTTQEQLKDNEAQFVQAIEKLKTVDLDIGFFESDEFQFFKDLTPDIVLPASVGRKNPFLPF